jgi:hypothetical protein
MSETTATLTPPDSTENEGTTPGIFHKAQLETIRKSEGLARAAQKPDYLPILANEGMDADALTNLLAQCQLWRQLSGQAVITTTAKEQQTGTGVDNETKLKREIEYLRGKARLHLNKQTGWSPSAITAFKSRYFIGSNIFANRALAEQSAGEIIKHAGEDALPAVTSERLIQSSNTLLAYIDTESPQSDAQSEATKLRHQRDTVFTEALRLRHEIQYAADAAWPWWDDANLPIRREFLLPAGRAFVG